MTDRAPHLTAGFWRTRRSAAIAGIVFGVLLLAAMIMLRIALSEGSFLALQADAQRRSLIRLSLSLVPFAGIAFLWFIGVVREQLGAVEDRLFSTVFMGSGLLFLAMLFTGAAISASLIAMLAGANVNADVFAYGRDTAQGLFSVYAMRMAAVFTLSVSTVGLRTSALARPLMVSPPEPDSWLQQGGKHAQAAQTHALGSRFGRLRRPRPGAER